MSVIPDHPIITSIKNKINEQKLKKLDFSEYIEKEIMSYQHKKCGNFRQTMIGTYKGSAIYSEEILHDKYVFIRFKRNGIGRTHTECEIIQFITPIKTIDYRNIEKFGKKINKSKLIRKKESSMKNQINQELQRTFFHKNFGVLLFKKIK